MLLGQFDSKLDHKSRASFPKRFRNILGEKLIITQGFETSLLAVSEDGWRSLLGSLEKRPFTDLPIRETQRFLFGGATFVELDEKGRFILPEYLKRYAGIVEDIVFVGLSRYVEVWEKNRWEAYQDRLSENIATIAQRLKQEDIKDE